MAIILEAQNNTLQSFFSARCFCHFISRKGKEGFDFSKHFPLDFLLPYAFFASSASFFAASWSSKAFWVRT